MNKETGVTWKLGMFVITGILLFAAAIYFIGDQRNLFGSTFKISTVFSTVSGLKIGNNVRFAGINIGTVDEIELITDTSVRVDIIIRKEVRKFIRKDAVAGIASDGLMGDKVLTVYPGTTGGMIDENAIILARDPVEMDDIMISVKESVDNISLITNELAEFTYKLNNGKGALSRLMNDEKFGKSLDATMTNLKEGSKGLSENMEAAKSNFLLKGYFNKKKKEAAKKAEELKKQEELKKKKKTDTNN